VSAIVNDQIYEIESSILLQPGPAVLTEGIEQIARIIAAAARGERLPRRKPGDLRLAGQ
jgi:iron complex transport system substrate-binding protein